MGSKGGGGDGKKKGNEHPFKCGEKPNGRILSEQEELGGVSPSGLQAKTKPEIARKIFKKSGKNFRKR